MSPDSNSTCVCVCHKHDIQLFSTCTVSNSLFGGLDHTKHIFSESLWPFARIRFKIQDHAFTVVGFWAFKTYHTFINQNFLKIQKSWEESWPEQKVQDSAQYAVCGQIWALIVEARTGGATR